MLKKISGSVLFALFSLSAAWAQLVVSPGEALRNDPSVRVGKLDNGLTYYIKQNGKPEKRAEFYLVTDVSAMEERPTQAGVAHFPEHMTFHGTKNFLEKGIPEGLASFPALELIDFDEKWHRPDLQAVVAVGDFNPEEIEQKIQALFAHIPKPDTPNPKELFPVPDNGDPMISIVTDPERAATTVSLFFKHEPFPKEMNSLGMTYIMDMMKSMASAMLNDRLLEVSQKPDAPFLAASVGFGSLNRTADVFQVGAASSDGEGITAFGAMLQELERVDRFGFTKSELERAKTNYIRRLEHKARDADDRTNSEFVGEYISHFRDNKPFMSPDYELEVAKGYLPFIRLSQMNELIKESITDQNRIILFSAPSKGRGAIPEENDFIQALHFVKNSKIEAYKEEVSAAPLMDASMIGEGKVVEEKAGVMGSTVWKLANGVRVVLKPTDFKKDEVVLTAFKQGGTSTLSTEDLPSVDAGLLMFMPLSGVSDFSLTELNKKLSGTIASVTPYISTYEQGFRGSASPKDFEVMLQLLYLRITSPRFVASAFAPVMAQLNAVVPHWGKQPDYLLNKELNKVLYRENPRRSMVDMEMVGKVDFSAMERIYKTLLGSVEGMTFVVVGNFDVSEIKPLIEKYIGSLPAREETPAWRDEGIYPPKGYIQHPFRVALETPKATIAQVYQGEMPNTPENKVKIAFLKQVLDLVYTETIREEEGGTYGVSVSSSVTNKPIDCFQLRISFDADPRRVDEMAARLRMGVSSLTIDGPSEEHVHITIENMRKQFEEHQIQNEFWSSMLLQYYRDHIDGYSEYERIVSGMTVEVIKEFVQQIVSQGNFIELMMKPE